MPTRVLLSLAVSVVLSVQVVVLEVVVSVQVVVLVVVVVVVVVLASVQVVVVQVPVVAKAVFCLGWVPAPLLPDLDRRCSTITAL